MANRVHRSELEFDQSPGPFPGTAPGKRSLSSSLGGPQIVFRVESAEAAAVFADRFGPRDDNGVAAAADTAVDRAAGSIGSPLPEELRGRFESSIGADLSGVRIHTGGESAEASSAVGAKAYTTGQDIHFGAGHYDPSSAFGVHLIAHEVAHTVQQQGAAPTRQHKLEVSAPQDGAELEADRAADAMVAGTPAVVGSVPASTARLRRVPEQTGTEHVGGDTADASPVHDRRAIGGGNVDGELLQPGQQGYSEVMVNEIQAAELQHIRMTAGDQLPVIKPATAGMERHIKYQAGCVAHFKAEEADNHHLARANRSGDAQGRLNLLYGQREEMVGMCNSHNQWRAFPNNAIVALEGLEEMKSMLGVGDEASMCAKLNEQLDGAAALLASAQADQNVAARTGGQDAELDAVKAALPKEDESASASASDAATALEGINVAHLNFRSTLIDVEKAEVDKTGNDDREEKARIEGIKAAVKSAASSLDAGMGRLAKAPGQIKTTIDHFDQAKAKHGAKKAALSGDADKNDKTAEQRLVESWGDLSKLGPDGNAPEGKSPYDPSPEGYTAPAADSSPVEANGWGFELPTSAGSAAGQGVSLALDIYYAEELSKIQKNLDTISAQVSGLGNASVTAQVEAKKQAFALALMAYAKATDKMKTAIDARKKAYVTFGTKLDELAKKRAAKGKSGAKPEKGGEMYATVFAICGQIGHITTVAAAASGKPHTKPHVMATFKRWTRSRNSGTPIYTQFPIQPAQDEIDTMSSLAASYEYWDETNDRIGSLRGVSAKAQAVLAKASGGKPGSGNF